MSSGNGYSSRKAWLDYVKNKSMAALSGPTPCLSVDHFLGATLQSNLCIFPRDPNLSCFLFLRALKYSAQTKVSKPLLLIFDKSNYWGKTEDILGPALLLEELRKPTGRPLYIEPKKFSDYVKQLLSDPAHREVFRKFKSDIFFWFGAFTDLKPASPFLRTFTEKAHVRFVCAGRSTPAEFVMLADGVIYSDQPWQIRTAPGSPERLLSDLLFARAATSTLGGFNLKS